MVSTNSDMFRHRSAIFRESTRDHKFDIPLQPLMAVTVILKIFKYLNSRIHKFDNESTHC